MQFFGPGHYRGRLDPFQADLATYPAYARESIGGDAATTAKIVPNATEENAFFGWPLLILVAVLGGWLWRHLMARLAVLVAVVAALLSLGETISWRRAPTGLPGPYRLLANLPLFSNLTTSRLALVTAAAIGVLLAFAADRVLRLAPAVERGGLPLRLLAAGTALAVLLPVAPTRVQTADRPTVPAFISSGHWRGYVSPGRTLVPVPIGSVMGIRWAAAAGVGFAVPEGYFLGPTGPGDPTGRWFAPSRPTQLLLEAVDGGRAPAIGAAQREQGRRDVRFWRADAVVLPVGAGREAALSDALTALYGPGRHVDDVWLWDV
jgi:hypothetical protein